MHSVFMYFILEYEYSCFLPWRSYITWAGSVKAVSMQPARVDQANS